MRDSREKTLVKNTILYFIGNFASKLLNIILVPVYMIYLDAGELGEIDLLMLLSSMLSLLFTLDMTDAAYRFMIDADKNEEKCVVVSSTLMTYMIGIIGFLMLFLPLNLLLKTNYGFLFAIHVFIVNFSQYLMQLCRGLKYNAHYAFAGGMLTLVQGILNIILIVYFKVGAVSLLIAQIIGAVIVVIYLCKVTRIFEYFKTIYVKKTIVQKMIKYSIPMFLQILLLWVIQNSGTYFLRYYTGDNTLSGIYAVSNKFPTIINSLASIFLLAWQENAIVSSNDKDAKEYYKKVYSTYFFVMIAFTSALLPMMKVYFMIVGNESYNSVWKYVPMFCVASILNGLSIFVSTQFMTEKKTVKIIQSMIVPTLLTFIINLLFVERFGIHAVGIAQVIGYSIMLAKRKKMVSGIYKLERNRKYIIIVILFLATMIEYYVTTSMPLLLGGLALNVIVTIFLERKEVKWIFLKISNKLRG